MDGLGTEGAALAIALILAKIVWDQVKQRKNNPHSDLCKVHSADILILRNDVKELRKEVADLRVLVAKLNGG